MPSSKGDAQNKRPKGCWGWGVWSRQFKQIFICWINVLFSFYFTSEAGFVPPSPMFPNPTRCVGAVSTVWETPYTLQRVERAAWPSRNWEVWAGDNWWRFVRGIFMIAKCYSHSGTLVQSNEINIWIYFDFHMFEFLYVLTIYGKFGGWVGPEGPLTVFFSIGSCIFFLRPPWGWRKRAY